MFNKIDRLPGHELEALEAAPDLIPCSALTKAHTQRLLEALEAALPRESGISTEGAVVHGA